jgi:hypothetical protein
MKKLKGPELKMPELKAPTFLADLYCDLRDRRLLPLVALALVAIAAVPFLLGGEVEQPVLPAAGAGAAALEASAGKTSKLTVVEATPGLRDYRKRLRDRSPTDPFEQQYTESAGGSTEGASSSSGSGEESVTTESLPATVEVETGGSSGGGSSNGSGGSGGSGPSQGTQLIEFVFDVQISHTETTTDGKQRMSEPEVRRRVPALAQLPGKKVPVVTVAGLNLHNGQVWFLVSNEVRSLDGDFSCVTRTPAGICELLEIEPGFPLELTYGPDKALFRLKVTNVDAVAAGKIGDGARSSRAAFGVPGDLSLQRP